MTDQEKEGKAFIKNGSGSNNGKMNNLHADSQMGIKRQIRQLKRYMIGLAALLALTFVILVITFSVLFANLKWDIENHDHPPKIGAQMNKVLEKEELCLLCNEVRLGPSVEEDQMLDYFVRKPGVNGRNDEECCVETPAQLLKLLQMFVEKKYREEMAHGNIKIDSSTDTGPGEMKPAAHLMGSVRKPEQPTVPGRQFPISHWISQEDLAFTSKVQYRHGRIVILEEGLYYVYSQLSFLEVFDNPNSIETGSQSLSHYIYRYNIIYPHGGEEAMIQNSITKCWGQNKAFGEYTSYLGAVFHLRQGDELFVKVSNLTLIVREPKLNYFGLFKVN
ncbi:tumor necrosis factor ligand superfamily member 10-like [Mercenaria mercenaria]|uniref:tumor necrosis factor ligand superfamily member 10-like n=1 Tax=Mercenaria mercenaria TaxID=6596 RepID=UPI00234F90BD|nr:tumor necrosis factor ligand superfamily member 10-like [Mercenaria mercenaria]XP_045201288.2 tumor necrosis factor ligand superfamily member 10-like [Mercenaria mercenaria]